MTTTLSHPIPAHSDIQAAIRTRLDWGIEVLQQLIAVDSIAPNELECQRLLYKLLSSEGLATELHEMSDLLRSLDGFHEDGLTLENRPNLVATYGGTKPGSQSLILNAHIDTVEWKTQVGSWKYLPLSGMIDNDCIYGRGALDDKGQIVMAAMAILALKDLAYCPPGKVILESVVGEEPSGNGTLALCSLGYTADAAINLEPTENHLHYGHRGVAGWRFHAHGRAEHGSVNGKSRNVIVETGRLAEMWQDQFMEWSDTQDAVYGPPSKNVGTIEGGSDIFTKPASCSLECAVRYAPGTFQKIETSVNQTLSQFAKSLQNSNISFQGELFLHHDASEAHPDSPLVKVLYDSICQVDPSRQKQTFPGGADARHFNNRYRIPAVLFGAGSLRQAHAENEFIPMDQWIQGAEILALMIARWCVSQEES